MNAGELPPFIGIRVKPFTEELRERSIRTLDIFLTELAAKLARRIAESILHHAAEGQLGRRGRGARGLCSRLEPMLDLEPGALRIELMIETPQSIFNERGEANLLPLVSAARGRCVAAHFGPYDYTASLEHRGAAAGGDASRVRFRAREYAGRARGDGRADRRRPGEHSSRFRRTAPRKDGGAHGRARRGRIARPSTPRGSCTSIRPAQPRNGFYQGWDLHPAQLPTRYAAVYSFFLSRTWIPPRSDCAISSRRPRRPRASATSSTMRRWRRAC